MKKIFLSLIVLLLFGSVAFAQAKNGNHFHVLIWAYNEKINDNIKDVVDLDLISPINDKISQTISRAKKLIPDKRYFIVRSVIEHDGHEQDK